MMKTQALEKTKQQLLTLKTELVASEGEYQEAAQIVELDQTRVGRLSRMDAMQSQQMALEQSRRRQQQIKKIDGALLRLENDEYGYCYVCGEEIDDKRLAVDPTSTRCMRCID